MKNSTLLGSAASVLLAFSVISYARTEFQQQDLKSAQQPTQPSTSQINSTLPGQIPVKDDVHQGAANPAIDETTATKGVTGGETYTATAYSLRGRTASGKPVARGLIAADPRILPLGTRVRIDAGSLSGEYVVADTGGAVKGRRIDIWTPTSQEAMRFGRRAIKLTVLEVGGRRPKTAVTRPRTVISLNNSQTDQTAASKK